MSEIKFNCTYCGHHVEFPNKIAGTEVKCPNCSKRLTVPDKSIQDSDSTSNVEVSTEEEHHVEPIPDGKVSSKEAMTAELSRWKEQLPEVKSAYKPSGKAPVAALLLMLIGVPFACMAGILGGGITGLVIGVVLGLILAIPFLAWLSILPKMAMGCGFIVAIIGGIIIGVVSFGAAGLVAATVIVFLGKIGKNRSPVIASVFAFTAALLVVVGTLWLISFIGDPEIHDFTKSGWGIAAIVIAGFVSAAISAGTAVDKVNSHKFCENCQKYMQEYELRALSYVGTFSTVRALTSGNMDIAKNLMKEAPGDRGVPKLFMCSLCGKGYLDIILNFKATWETGDKKKPTDEKTESWLVASFTVDPTATQEFLQLWS